MSEVKKKITIVHPKDYNLKTTSRGHYIDNYLKLSSPILWYK